MDINVTVVLTTYKRPWNIVERAINSVLKQTYTNLELIIVDDSPDEFKDRNLIEQNIKNINDNRIQYIQHKYNQGACAARNTGVKNSTGFYIGFLDDDDEWLPEKIELQLKKFDKKDIGLVYCHSNTVVLKNNIVVDQQIRAYRHSGLVYKKLLKRNFIGSTSFPLLKRKVFDKVGYFKEDLKSAQDYDLWLRISKEYEINFVDKPLVNYYAHDGIRITTNVDNKIQGLEYINQLNIDVLKKDKKLYSLRKAKLILYYYERDGYWKALKKTWEAFRIYPFNIILIKNFIKFSISQVKFNKK